MRKQTKIAAIVSAAALLAIGASMTSFAATGWQEEDGSWVYYNKNGEQVTDTWEKSGANWFYLGDDGVMATDQLIEYNENYYYVDANGAMVTERWIAIDNEDAGDEDEPDVHWYYFQANGKALKKGDSHEHIFKKTLPGGKTYAFDSEGRMLYGWVRYSDGERQTGDTAWKEAEYYFGDENDGAMTVGWREIALTDDDAEDAQPGDSFWDEDQVRWFYFKSSGKKENGSGNSDGVGSGKLNKKINGKKYGFDEWGRKIADWYAATPDEDLSKQDKYYASGSDAIHGKNLPSSKATNVDDYTRTFMYFSSPEDGARHSKSWFKVVPGYYQYLGKYEDGDDYWYYADGDGYLVTPEIKSIKGKKYAFDNKGRMKKGLQLMKVDGNVSCRTGKVILLESDHHESAIPCRLRSGKEHVLGFVGHVIHNVTDILVAHEPHCIVIGGIVDYRHEETRSTCRGDLDRGGDIKDISWGCGQELAVIDDVSRMISDRVGRGIVGDALEDKDVYALYLKVGLERSCYGGRLGAGFTQGNRHRRQIVPFG